MADHRFAALLMSIISLSFMYEHGTSIDVHIGSLLAKTGTKLYYLLFIMGWKIEMQYDNTYISIVLA